MNKTCHKCVGSLICLTRDLDEMFRCKECGRIEASISDACRYEVFFAEFGCPKGPDYANGKKRTKTSHYFCKECILNN